MKGQVQTVTISSAWVQTFCIPVLAILMPAVGMDPGKALENTCCEHKTRTAPVPTDQSEFARSMFFLLLMHVKFDVLSMSLLICPGPFFFPAAFVPFPFFFSFFPFLPFFQCVFIMPSIFSLPFLKRAGRRDGACFVSFQNCNSV